MAKRGNALAQFNLGLMYDKGEGVKRNYKMAVKWYKLAASKNSALAQYSLGWMHSQGWGSPKDNAEALDWYRLAAKQGHVESFL